MAPIDEYIYIAIYIYINGYAEFGVKKQIQNVTANLFFLTVAPLIL